MLDKILFKILYWIARFTFSSRELGIDRMLCRREHTAHHKIAMVSYGGCYLVTCKKCGCQFTVVR